MAAVNQLALSMCSICNVRPLSGFSYGALCCGACKMFFRRVLFVKNIDQCRRGGNCLRKCRDCRFKKCIEAGMTWTPPEPLSILNTNTDPLSALIFNLSHHEDRREFLLMNCFYHGDPTVMELAKIQGTLKFRPRPPSFPMTLPLWVFTIGITSLDYLRKFVHVNLLNDSDRAVLLKHTFFDFSLFTDAMRAQKKNQDFISFPDGMDIIKPGVVGVTDEFLDGIRCRLPGKVNQLKVTKEEFLLLSQVFFCNPAITDLSESGRGFLNTYQKIYSSALLQYCMLTYKHAGPARFTELLSIFQVIFKTKMDIRNLVILNTLRGRGPNIRQIHVF
ncbi:unnamed protein product [Caenorhabditis nigoni]